MGATSISRNLLAIASMVLLLTGLLTTGCGGSGGSEQALPIRSDDGLVEIHIPNGALPSGVKLSEVKVSRVSDQASPLVLSLPAYVYRLEPEGLRFQEPVPLTLKDTVRAGKRAAAQAWIASADGLVEFIDTTTAYQADSNEVTVTIKVPHFSYVGVSFEWEGSSHPLYGIWLSTPREAVVNEPFIAFAGVAWDYDDFRVYEQPQAVPLEVRLAQIEVERAERVAQIYNRLVRAMELRVPTESLPLGEPSQRPTQERPRRFLQVTITQRNATGRFDAENASPSVVADAPRTTEFQDLVTASEYFRCREAGHARIEYRATVIYEYATHEGDLSQQTPGGLREVLLDDPRARSTGTARNELRVGETVRCLGSAPTPTPTPPSTRPPRPPVVTAIQVTLSVPVTRYSVTADDPEGGTLTYEWRMSGEACGTPHVPWIQTGPTVRWSHASTPPDSCGHQGTDHDVNVAVTVTSSTGGSVQCLITGSEPRDLRNPNCI